MGKAKKEPTHSRKINQVGYRLNDSEWADLQTATRLAGASSPSDFARQAMVWACKRVIAIAQDPPDPTAPLPPADCRPDEAPGG